jgi:hypothetical protein
MMWICTVGALLALMTPAAASAAHRSVAAPMRLPGPASTRAGGADGQWLVGARPGIEARRIAQRWGARARALDGVFEITPGRARALAGALRGRGLLRYAEPNIALHRASALEGQTAAWARGAVVNPTLAAPAPGAASIAVIDDFIDPADPDVGPQTRYLNTSTGIVAGPHGTEVASAAAGAVNGIGVVGVFPGAPLLSYQTDLSCADTADGVLAAVKAGARVINLSLGSPDPCFTLEVAVAGAYGQGALIVAAAGNEFAQGNPVEYPAAFPHVLSVAAVDQRYAPAFFSNANAAVDIAAPGVQVPVSLPVAVDTDGAPDGVTFVDGTSFAAPIVAGAAAWLATARPGLSNGQLADILRRSAIDLSPGGYDAQTGFGLVNVVRALGFATPKRDILEPNDEIAFVDGTVFSAPDPFVWRGSGVHQLRGSTVDAVEDPIDVYRIRIPRHAQVKLLMTPNFGLPSLSVFSSAARSTADRGQLIATGHGARAKSLVLINRASHARAAYVVITAPASLSLDASYRLDFLRQRRR